MKIAYFVHSISVTADYLRNSQGNPLTPYRDEMDRRAKSDGAFGPATDTFEIHVPIPQTPSDDASIRLLLRCGYNVPDDFNLAAVQA